jgi:hypothetical protein
MFRKSIALLIYCCNIFTVVQGSLTRIPVATVLVPGDYLRLNCSSNALPVGWWYTKPGSTAANPVLDKYGNILQPYQSLYKIDNSSRFDLLGLQPANATYCGTYKCNDDFFNGQEVSVDVSYGGTPLCTVNTTTVTSDGLVQFNCTVEICGVVTRQLSIFINGSVLLTTTNSSATIVEPGSYVTGSEVNCTVSYGSWGTFTDVCPQIQQHVTTTTQPATTTTTTTTTAASKSTIAGSNTAAIIGGVVGGVGGGILLVVIIIVVVVCLRKKKDPSKHKDNQRMTMTAVPHQGLADVEEGQTNPTYAVVNAVPADNHGYTDITGYEDVDKLRAQTRHINFDNGDGPNDNDGTKGNTVTSAAHLTQPTDGGVYAEVVSKKGPNAPPPGAAKPPASASDGQATYAAIDHNANTNK